MKKYLVFAIALVAISTSALAQDRKPARPDRPDRDPAAGRTMKPSRGETLKDTYADSVEFKKAFEELFAIVKPEESITDRAEKIFKQQSRTFKRNGIDSVKAREAVFAAIDTKMDREVIYTAYRSQLTAEELKAWVAFIKTPAGKKILSVGNRLLSSSESKIDQQIRRTISSVIAPMRKPVQRASAPNGQNPAGGTTPRSEGTQENNDRENSDNNSDNK